MHRRHRSLRDGSGRHRCRQYAAAVGKASVVGVRYRSRSHGAIRHRAACRSRRQRCSPSDVCRALALFSQDADGRIVRWNRGAERIFGYSEDEIVGERARRRSPLRTCAAIWSRSSERVGAGERVDRVVTEIQRKDGMPVPIALSVSPGRRGTGAFVGAVGVAQELTETRLAQAALAEVEQRFSEWEALAHVGRWLWDVGTDAVQWSDELHRMHGVDPLEFEGTLDGPPRACCTPTTASAFARVDGGCGRSGQPFEDEYRVARRRRDALVRDPRRAGGRARPARSSACAASSQDITTSAQSDDEPHPIDQITGPRALIRRPVHDPFSSMVASPRK